MDVYVLRSEMALFAEAHGSPLWLVSQLWCTPASLGTCLLSSRGCIQVQLDTTCRCCESKNSSASTKSQTRWGRGWKSTSNTPGRTPTASTWTWYERGVVLRSKTSSSGCLRPLLLLPMAPDPPLPNFRPQQIALPSVWLCGYHSVRDSVQCSAIATCKMKATVAACALSDCGFPPHDSVDGTYISLSFPCLPHVKWNDPTTLVRAGGTCVLTPNVDLNVPQF